MNKITDERIINEKRQINSKAFGVAMISLWIMIDVRLIILDQNILEFIDIFTLTMILSLYVVFQMIYKGNFALKFQNSSKKKVFFIGGFVGAIAFVLVQLWSNSFSLSSTQEIVEVIIGFFVFWIVWVGVQYLLVHISSRQSNKI